MADRQLGRPVGRRTGDGHWNTMTEVVAPQGHICSIVETSAPVDIGPLT